MVLYHINIHVCMHVLLLLLLLLLFMLKPQPSLIIFNIKLKPIIKSCVFIIILKLQSPIVVLTLNRKSKLWFWQKKKKRILMHKGVLIWWVFWKSIDLFLFFIKHYFYCKPNSIIEVESAWKDAGNSQPHRYSSHLHFIIKLVSSNLMLLPICFTQFISISIATYWGRALIYGTSLHQNFYITSLPP